MSAYISNLLQKITTILESPSQVPEIKELYEIESRIKEKITQYSSSFVENSLKNAQLHTITEYPLAENESEIKTLPTTTGIEDFNELLLSSNRERTNSNNNLSNINNFNNFNNNFTQETNISNEILHNVYQKREVYQDALRSKGLRLPKTMGFLQQSRQKGRSFYLENRQKTKSHYEIEGKYEKTEKKGKAPTKDLANTTIFQHSRNKTMCFGKSIENNLETPLLKVNLKEFAKLKRTNKINAA